MIAYESIAIAVVSLWLSNCIVVWGAILALSLTLALTHGAMDGNGLVWTLLLAGSAYAYFRCALVGAAKVACAVSLALLTLGLYGHLLPGFHEWTVLPEQVLVAGAYPTSIIWNFEKPMAGLLLIGFGIPRARRWAEWKSLLPPALKLFLACAVLLAAGGVALHAIAWAPHFSRATALFTFTNLFLVVIPEEAFFRGFVQAKLEAAFEKRRYAGSLSVALAALFFGICHFQGGPGLMLVATIAGLFYGEAFRRTRQFEASILVHFLLNFTHFTFFTYPALRP